MVLTMYQLSLSKYGNFDKLNWYIVSTMINHYWHILWAYYVPIEFIQVRKLWDCGKQVETICIEPKRLEIKSC
jgi:hypothetical protein